MQEWLSVPQVAARLGKGRVTIWRWVKERRLQPTGYVGRDPFFDPAYIDAYAGWLAGGQVGSAPSPNFRDAALIGLTEAAV